MYPYRTRMAWLLGNRYAHLIRALNQRRGLQDTVLEARVEAMRFWNQVRFMVLLLLSIGIAAAAATWLAQYVPAFERAVETLSSIAKTISLISGVVTLAYLFVLRLLGQLEADILAILTLDRPSKP